MGGFNFGGALGGATSGASTGSMFGPWGTLVGAGLGAAAGGTESQGGGGSPVPGSPAQLMQPERGDQSSNSYAPPSMPSMFGGGGTSNMPISVRDHLLRQLKERR